jgi:hypothetical protein
MAKNGFALILDADERLFPKDFEELKKKLGENFTDYWFTIENIEFDKKPEKVPCWVERLFLKEGVKFRTPKQSIYERRETNRPSNETNSGVSIKHFLPRLNGFENKRNEWYHKMQEQGFLGSPSKQQTYSSWKEFNPKRKEYPPYV